MKIAAVVVLYHPEDNAIANIKTYYDFIDVLYVFDNTETIVSGFAEKLQPFSKIHFFHDGANKGIAHRLNTAGELAAREGFNWLLTMDQDTTFSTNAITGYIQCVQQYEGKEQVAVFATQYSRQFEVSVAACTPETVTDAITSGSLINLTAFHAIGKFDENLFIDLLDFEYCARAGMAGYTIVRFNNIHIIHTIGAMVKRSSIKSLFLIKKERQVHSPLRCYYSYRNMLYLEARYRQTNPDFARSMRLYINGYIRRNLFYGRNTIQLLKYLAKAKKDFKNGQMGKIS